MTTDTAHEPAHGGAYFDELAAALRSAGVPREQIDCTVADLRGHLAATGTGPEAEFGPAAAFAARLGGLAPLPGEPDGTAESWTWTADLFNDRRMLAVHGDRGWEVESLDALGRFVCRRAPGVALRWEYRREVIGGRRREMVLGELEPEGWELCGEWMVYGYFKRPKAARTGPAEQAGASRGRLFLSRRGKVAMAVWAVAALTCLGVALTELGLPGYVIALFGVGWAISATYTAKLETQRAHARQGG
ncbi:hypothetical protein [Streptomyces lateritius]|uniref:hypothetical protein n=1 Tax=Streptomyces lateritius TaxID=67313 RepID=UPI00167645F4|nr:hypothetical protein [Streptomyces lateritius]GGU00779.1 hypothetical protein GCM10010272_52200 [Streptomyces lateritius]